MIMKMVYGMFRPYLADWIKKRALRLPEADAQKLSKEHGITVEKLRVIEDKIQDKILELADKKVNG